MAGGARDAGDAARDAGADRRRGDRAARLPADRATTTTSSRTTSAMPKVEGVFSRLRELLVANGTPAQRDALGRLNSLVGKKLAELEAAIALYKKDGPQAAQALLDTGIGKRTMDEIRAEVDGMASRAARQLDEATSRWAARHRVRAARHADDDGVHGGAAAGRLAARAPRRAAARGAPAQRRRRTSGGWRRWSRSAPPSCRSSPTTCRSCARTRNRSSRATSTTSWAASWSARRWTSPGSRSAMKQARPGSGGEARARAAGARRRRADQAAHHRGAAPDAARQPRAVGGARLAGPRDLRPRRARVHDRDAARRQRDRARTCRSRSTGSCRKR